MTQEREPLDITDSPDLLRMAEEVSRSNQPLPLKGNDKIVAVLMPPQGEPGTMTAEQVQEAKRTLREHFGSVTPHRRPEDFAALREEFERGVAEDARTRGQQ